VIQVYQERRNNFR